MSDQSTSHATAPADRDAAEAEPQPGRSASLYALALRQDLRGKLKIIGSFAVGDFGAELVHGSDSLWLVVRRPERGGLAVRAAYAPGGFETVRKVRATTGDGLRLEAVSALGTHRVQVDGSGDDLHRLRVRSTLMPCEPLLVPFAPRDLYPLDAGDDPLGSHGTVHAAQRGPNSGLVYLTLDDPAFGEVLYFQNLTALNPYFRATGTKPMGVVGGEWPELGYLPPCPPQSGTPPVNPLPAGEEVMMSDAIIVLRDFGATSEQEKARQFLQMLGEAYRALDLPRPCYRDWEHRARRTLKDLQKAPDATCRSYGHLYVRPYVAAEYPDSMVQMTIMASLYDFAAWSGKPIELADELAAGMGKFYDPRLRTLRRYLPNVGEDKDANAVDAWYLYHPLRNLARLALDGQDWARDLFLRSIDYAIKAAHHFKYVWPIQYDVRDFSVITATREDEEHGQTDVGGFYAYVMLQAFELTGEARYLDEARAAIDAAVGMRFELEYEANLTAWGAAACMRLWRITEDARYREQALVYLASLFHNCEIWESQIGAAEHYSNFLGATALHDAPYMAMYECFDSFAALEQFVRDSGPELDPAVRMLVCEYCKYVLHRGWYYYPDALPADVLATENRNGHINNKLSFPLEDLYADGSQPGQVGQEVYGAGAAFVLASRAFHQVEDAPFRLFCNYFLLAKERTGDRALSIQLTGTQGCTALFVIVRHGRAKLPECQLVTAGGDPIRPSMVADERIEFNVPADARVVLTWSQADD
ncbi:hypothetical protein V5740_13595 [Croceibacterium sp. TMG7-5b_MA50]|uniref:hypothetical protein n=1 Tax=Croceibacterium sp. TMG7-5b_MA50 TaxID=3121290 RepID=UPI0032217F94